ncbi:MAG: hypothetical protein HY817_02460 [Candidatus Abawacabacteria bacterium]|nr:hypothetical protein [Candidatus Abawacabacteria bacterium]
MSFIKNLSEVSEQDTKLIGKKAAVLAELLRLGTNVPAGFILTTEAFEQWQQNGKREISTAVQTELLASFDHLDTEKVAVRSSAIGEDGKVASWAGQFETVLNVERNQLVAAVLKCWQAASSTRVKAYAAQHAIDISKNPLALLIQVMISSEVAGVAFSLHPVTQSTEQILIEAVSGIGESLVSGAVTPDRFVVEKSSDKVIEHSAHSTTLTDHEIVQLSAIIKMIEKQMQCPVDVEWAKVGSEFFILQSRPVTTQVTTNDDNTLRPTVKRDLSLFSVQAWQKGYGEYFEKSYGYTHRAFFYYDGKKVNFYPRLSDFSCFKKVIIPMVIHDQTLFQRLNTQFKADISELKAIKDISRENITEIFDLIARSMSFYMLVVGDAFVEARPEAWESRHMSEGVLYEVDEKVEQFLQQLLQLDGRNPKWAHVMSLEEVLAYIDQSPLDWSVIERRLNGYIIQDNRLLAEQDFNLFCTENHLLNPEILADKQVTELKGDIAYPGIVSGKVKLVLNREDIDHVEAGDIMVCTMTNVNYYPAMRKAAGVITDEGGITCHAAIAVRELKKVCLVGTKQATQLLKDGDMVTLDAQSGRVLLS